MADIRVIPFNYADLTNITVDSTYTINRAYTNADSGTFTRLNITPSLTGSVFFIFDVSQLPQDIEIQSVTARFKARINGTNRVLNPIAQLYSGTTAKGTATTFSTTTATVFNMSPGTWTRDELNGLRIKVSGTASTGGSVRRIDFFGADVDITYISAGYAKVIRATQLAVQIANDDTHGYDQRQSKRYGPDFDCSSLVSYCLQQAGFNIDPHGTYTGNLAKKLTDLGFTNVRSDIQADGTGLQYGDILLTVTNHHTGFSLGEQNGVQMICDAISDEHGGKGGDNTQTGDQTGREIMVRRFRSSIFYRSFSTLQYVFRWTDGGGGSDPYPVGGTFVIRIPELRRGKRFAVIGPVQSVLANYYNISVGPSGADGIFGADTEKAVKQFQEENGLKADGIVGEKTMEKLLKL